MVRGALQPRATTFDQCDVAPAAVVAADAFAGADDPESGRPMQGEAGGVLGEDAGLDRPDAGRLGRADECLEQTPANPATAMARVYVDGVLDDAGVRAP